MCKSYRKCKLARTYTIKLRLDERSAHPGITAQTKMAASRRVFVVGVGMTKVRCFLLFNTSFNTIYIADSIPRVLCMFLLSWLELSFPHSPQNHDSREWQVSWVHCPVQSINLKSADFRHLLYLERQQSWIYPRCYSTTDLIAIYSVINFLWNLD